MKWVEDAGFTFANMAPAEMILGRHVYYLREDTELVALFGGAALDPLKIRCCPFGRPLDLDAPGLSATIPSFDRQPAPGVFIETVTIRDVIRFHSEQPTSDEPLYEPGLLTVASHLIGVVTAPGARQLNYTTIGGDVVQLATRVDLTEVSTEQVDSPQNGEGVNLFDLRLDFKYRIAVRVGDPRLWPLVTVGA